MALLVLKVANLLIFVGVVLISHLSLIVCKLDLVLDNHRVGMVVIWHLVLSLSENPLARACLLWTQLYASIQVVIEALSDR